MFGRLCARSAHVEEGLLQSDDPNVVVKKEDRGTKVDKRKYKGDILVVKILLPYLWTNHENKARIVVALLFLILSKVIY